jgi:hypothetical protein
MAEETAQNQKILPQGKRGKQGNWVTVSGKGYNWQETDQRTTNKYDQKAEGKQTSTSKYDSKDTTKYNQEAEADGNCSKRRRKHETKKYYRKAGGKQGNQVTVRGDDYNRHETDQRTTNNYDREAEESKKAPANTTAKTPGNATRRQRQTAIVPNNGGSTKPKNTTPRRQGGSKEIG